MPSDQIWVKVLCIRRDMSVVLASMMRRVVICFTANVWGADTIQAAFLIGASYAARHSPETICGSTCTGCRCRGASHGASVFRERIDASGKAAPGAADPVGHGAARGSASRGSAPVGLERALVPRCRDGARPGRLHRAPGSLAEHAEGRRRAHARGHSGRVRCCGSLPSARPVLTPID